MPPRHIPLELHHLILTHTPSTPATLPWLWRSARRASRLARAAAERVVAERHLRHARTAVVFPLGEGAIGGGGGRGVTVYGLEVRLSFCRFEEEGDRRAVFRDARPEGSFGAGVLEATRARWREAVGSWSADGGEEEGVCLRPDMWGYWVEIRGLALDPGLPDLRVDYERREISFDWRRMLDEFFGEEAYARRCLEELQTLDEKPGTDAMKDAGERQESSSGQIRMSEQGKTWHSESIGDGLLNPRRELTEPEHRAYVAARRQRIKKWYGRQQRNEELRDDHWLSSRNDILLDGVRDAAEHDRVLEMFRRREELAKDVSICDNANEVRAVYRWNPEHDSISL